MRLKQIKLAERFDSLILDKYLEQDRGFRIETTRKIVFGTCFKINVLNNFKLVRNAEKKN